MLRLKRITLLAISVVVHLFGASQLYAQANPNLFYYMADDNNDLYSWHRVTFTNTNIGDAGVGGIEAIAFWPLPGDRRLFAADDGDFGVIDTNTGTFTLIGEIDGGGTANGAEGPQSLNDVDGLAFDGQTGRLWASERNGGTGDYDYIFLIDTATGLFIPNAFGIGIDYLVVDGEGLFEDVDDIAFDPISGRIYANSNVGGTNDLLIQINKYTGEVDAVTSLSEDDVEGLAFHNGGQMYGSEGDDDRISRVNEETGVMTIQDTVAGGDIEGLAALVADASTVTGRVFDDLDQDGVDDSESGVSGITIDLFLDVDSSGTVGPDDPLIQSAVTDGTGGYSFYFATIGYLVVKIRESTVPSGYANTTDLIETAVFLDTVDYAEIDSLNDFGIATGSDCDGDGIPSFFEGTVDTDGDGVLDSCDLDSDDDGILDALTRIQDTDGDGLPNYLDLDSDNDGIPDAVEANGGYEPTGFNSATGRIAGADTDGDGLKDDVDAAPAVAYGSGSVTLLPIPDTDHDGFEDQVDLDADNDGILDILEGGGTDSDLDGVVDNFTDANTDGLNDATLATPYNIANSDSTYEATNGMELKPNYRDNDSDNDGIDDTREGQTTADYETAILDLDSDNDGIIDFWDVSVGGNAIDPYDRDSDGTPDYFDLDTDNDGVIDFIEGNDADMNGVADVALSNTDADSNGIDDAFDGGCTLTELSISATSYGEQQGSSVDVGSSDLELTREDAEQTVGIYWPNLYIQSGQSIANAYIQFETDETGYSGTVNLTIRGELSTNASTFTSSSNNVTNRTTTTDSVTWTITNTWNSAGETGADQRTTDVSSILEEIVSQGGWTTGSPVVMIIDRTDGGSNRRVAENDPVLYYTVGDSIFAAHGCESNVAVQNSDSDSERDWRDTDDDADGILTINEDINGNNDWSDDFTQGGSPSPDYLTFSPCPGGTSPQVDTFYATSVVVQNGVSNSTNGLNAPDDSYAEFYDSNDSMTIELPVTIQAGQEYTVFYKHRNYSTGLPGGATIRLRESPDNSTYTNQPTEPSTFSLINTDSATLTAQVNIRYLRIYNPGTNPDFDFDAIRYIRTQCQGDNDGDGIADNIDIDDDNDGIPDTVENISTLDPTADDDNDGVFNFEDADYCTINSNGVCDSLDFDGDGIINQFDIDADNDGILDMYESGISYATLATIDTDTNGILDDAFTVGTNGLGDVLETSADNDVINYTIANTDGDGVNDALDLDSDNDGITDLAENQNGTDSDENGVIDGSTDSDNDGMLDSGDSDVANEGSPGTFPLDSDNDGVPNYLDIDSDNDGITDHEENVDGTGTDANNDGIVDGSADADNDGILDSADSDDSAIGSPNSDPTDTDGDGIANPYDIDADDDGIIDNIEAQATTGSPTQAGGTDTDGDGLDNVFETTGLSPVDTDSDGTPDYLDTDSDGDGFPDLLEGWDTDADYFAETSPAGTDSDNDGLDDNFDAIVGPNDTTNPSNNGQDANDFPDTTTVDQTTERDWREANDWDGDGVADGVDLDDDNDGIPDTDEAGGNEPDGDEDGDGMPNWLDTSDDGNGGDGSVTDYTDSNGDGIPDVYDFDSDGIPNHRDIDSDDDGIVDILEAGGTDVNQDGEVDYPTPGDPTSMTDADNDGLDDNRDDEDSGSGGGEVTNGTPWPEPNTDGQGNVNYLDIDADDDGIVDNTEAQATASYIAPDGTDTDGDGLDDAYDPDDGGTYITPVNTEGTGDEDYIDTDTDDDGEADSIEGHDSDGDGVADSGSPASTGVSGGTTDIDGDGLLDGYDNNTASRDPTNTNLNPSSHPNTDAGTSERDWREVPCGGGTVVLSPNNTTTTANNFCENDPWTYYYDPSDPTELLFAVEHFPASGNTNSFTLSVDLTVSTDPETEAGVYSATDVGNQQATFVMGRYYNISITSGSLNGAVNIRYFYNPDEADTLEAVAERWNDANAGSTAFVSGRRWFMMNSGTFDPGSADLQADGIQSSTELFPASSGTIDGIDYVQFEGLTSLTGGSMAYSIGTNSVILPVELLSFTAQPLNDDVLVVWSTATELNSDYFEVERSADMQRWDYVGTVDAAGNSQNVIDYELMDTEPHPGTSYYRLKQFDRDNSMDLSDVATVTFGGKVAVPQMTIYPNPNEGSFVIELSQESSLKDMWLHSATGEIVRYWRAGELNTGRIDVHDLSAGTYLVRLNTSQGVQAMRVVVQ